MKINIYELLGMIKDGKAPKKIKYDGMIWKFEEDNLYYSDSVWLDDYCNISQILNDEVEILEEEKKIPEKLTQFEAPFLKGDKPDIRFSLIIDQINEIIDYLKSKGDE